jgi:hypothetical protein
MSDYSGQDQDRKKKRKGEMGAMSKKMTYKK